MNKRVILHIDGNSFYASIEVLYNPKLRGKPVSVCGRADLRHGIVLASTPEAKRYGVKTGDPIFRAKQACPELIITEPHMDRYVRLSGLVREILSEYSPCVEPYGLDENWCCLTGTGHLFGEVKQVADSIRERIKRELGITVSVGVSFNKSLAKLGSDVASADTTMVIEQDRLREVVWPRPASELLFVGPATTKKLHDMGIDTIGQLAQAPAEFIERRLHKPGLLVWNYANGRDYDPVREIGYQQEICSVGNSITTCRDMITPEDIRVTTMLLAESVAERMRKKLFRCQTVQVYIRYSSLASMERQVRLPFPSATAQRIGDTAYQLILKNWTGDPLRSLGVRGCNLLDSATPQLSLLPEQQGDQRQEDLELTVQDLRRRYGHFAVQRGIMVADKGLGGIDTQADDSAHTIAFYKGA